MDTAKAAGWTFIQAFLATLLMMAPGVLEAPDLQTARALIVSALVAAVAAGLSALKNFLAARVAPSQVASYGA